MTISPYFPMGQLLAAVLVLPPLPALGAQLHSHGPVHGQIHGQVHGQVHDLVQIRDRQANRQPGPGFVVDHEARTVRVEAVLQRSAFDRADGPDGQYHAIVNRDGGAAAKALFVTEASDVALAAALRALGAEDGGGVPLSAWSLRNVPLLPQPTSRVTGTRVEVTLHWEGADRSFGIDELLEESGDRGVEMRFGGNEEHDEHWESGCILCLFSCPGGVLSNARYSIRDHVRETTRFSPGSELPADGTPVTITLHLSSG